MARCWQSMSGKLFFVGVMKIGRTVCDERIWSFLRDFFCAPKQCSDIRRIFCVGDLLSNPESYLVIHESIQIFWMPLTLRYNSSTRHASATFGVILSKYAPIRPTYFLIHLWIATWLIFTPCNFRKFLNVSE